MTDDREDTLERAAISLAGDPQIWLSLLWRRRRQAAAIAAGQLSHLLGSTIEFDPDADEADAHSADRAIADATAGREINSRLGRNMPIDALQCQRCAVALQPGIVTEVRPQHYMQPVSWIAGEPEETLMKNLKVDGKQQHPIRAYRCPQCGRLEFFAE